MSKRWEMASDDIKAIIINIAQFTWNYHLVNSTKWRQNKNDFSDVQSSVYSSMCMYYKKDMKNKEQPNR